MPDAIHRFADHPLPVWLQRFQSSPNAEERYRALQAVISLSQPEDAVGWLWKGLNDADSAVRAGTAHWLAAQAGKSPRPGTSEQWATIQSRWQQLLNDDDPDVRWESARGLLLLNADVKPATAVLLQFLSDDDTQPVMLAAILQILGQAAGTLADQPLPWERLLHHPQTEVREQAARTIGLCGTAAVQEETPHLIPLLDDDEPFVREEAARALGRIGVALPAILSALEAAMTDEDPIVAETAGESLQALRAI